MKELFVDSGAWLALADRSDKWHEAARTMYPELLHRYGRLVTTNLIIAESYTLIRRRLGQPAAVTFLDSLQRSARLQAVYSNEALESAAQLWLRQYADQMISYVDAVSFAVMAEREIEEVFGFDGHFRVAGYTLVAL